MTSDCCLSTSVHLVCGDSVLVALVTHQLQANLVTRYQLQVFTKPNSIDIPCGAKKTAPFYFCNSFVRASSIKTIFGTHVLQ